MHQKSLAAGLTACLLLASSIAIAVPMNNDDVVKLVKAGLAEPLVLSTIDGSEAQFDTSADGLIKLKQAGVSDAVIQRVLARKSAAASASGGTKTGPVGAPASASGGECKLAGDINLQAVLDEDKQISLPFRTANYDSDVTAGSTLASVFTFGIVSEKGTISASIPGVRSATRVKSRQPVFLDMPSLSGQAADEAFSLVKLTPNTKEGKRSVQVAEASAGLLGSKERSSFLPGALQSLKLERLQQGCTIKGDKYNIHRGMPATPLVPGEYAVMYGDMLYDFGVD